MAKAKQVPTEDSPELGALEIRGVVLSEGEHWQEDGDYVFRSSDFDIIVGAPTFDEALRRFGDDVIDFISYLGSLENPAENELEMIRLAAPRITQIASLLKTEAENEGGDERMSEADCDARRPVAGATRRRLRDDHVSRWLPTTRRRNSLRLSHV